MENCHWSDTSWSLCSDLYRLSYALYFHLQVSLHLSTCVTLSDSLGVMLIIWYVFRWCKRKHYASSSTAILMDTYQAEGGLDEETQMSSTLRVGDGAVIERVSEALADNPTPYSHFETSVAVNSTEGDDDSVDEEDMPLLGSDEKATESTPSDLLLQCSLSSTPLRRPTELPLPFSLFRSSPEGQSLSSLSTSPSPVSSADSHQVTPPNSPSHLS